MSHKLVSGVGDTSGYLVRCKCGKTSGIKPTEGQAHDWFYMTHIREVEKLQAALGTKTPRLETQYRHYVQMAEDPSVTDYDRRLWQQLAEELATRLGLNAPAWEQPELF